MEFSVLDDGCYCEQGESFVFFIRITELHKTATSSIGNHSKFNIKLIK